MKYTIQLYNPRVELWDDFAETRSIENAKLIKKLMYQKYLPSYIRINRVDKIYIIDTEV